MQKQLPATNQPPVLPGPLGGHILARLVDLEARADRLARQAEAAGEFKTALAATKVSVSILTHLARLADQCPQAAQSWQPHAVESQPTPKAPCPTQNQEKISPSTNPEPETENSELPVPPATPTPTSRAGPESTILRPVNADWHR